MKEILMSVKELLVKWETKDPPKRQKWSERQATLNERWSESRAIICKAVFQSMFSIPEDEKCYSCSEKVAVVRCHECTRAKQLCSYCDQIMHERWPFHDRDALVNGHYIPISTTTSKGNDGEWVIVGKYCSFWIFLLLKVKVVLLQRQQLTFCDSYSYCFVVLKTVVVVTFTCLCSIVLSPFFVSDLFHVILQPPYKALFILLFQVGIINIFIVTLFMTKRCLQLQILSVQLAARNANPLKFHLSLIIALLLPAEVNLVFSLSCSDLHLRWYVSGQNSNYMKSLPSLHTHLFAWGYIVF